MSNSHNSTHIMVRTNTTARVHFESQSIFKESVGDLNIMNEITCLHREQNKTKNKQTNNSNNKLPKRYLNL